MLPGVVRPALRGDIADCRAAEDDGEVGGEDVRKDRHISQTAAATCRKSEKLTNCTPNCFSQ